MQKQPNSVMKPTARKQQKSESSNDSRSGWAIKTSRNLTPKNSSSENTSSLRTSFATTNGLVSSLTSVFSQKSHSRSTEMINKTQRIQPLSKPNSADQSRRMSTIQVFQNSLKLSNNNTSKNQPIPVTQASIGAHPNNPLRIAILGADNSGKSALVCKMTTGRFIHTVRLKILVRLRNLVFRFLAENYSENLQN